MKSIGAGSEQAKWNQRVVLQLSFIKKHLRYPIDRATAMPAVLLAASMPALAMLSFIAFFTKSTSHYHQRWPLYMVLSMILIIAGATIRRHWQTLHFLVVPARRDTGSNMRLLQQFLQQQHFAFARHPELPEIFQIISKNIAGLRDEREVVFFIADEGRILVNSHFTHSGARYVVGASHCRQIAGMLREWIKNADALNQKGLQVF